MRPIWGGLVVALAVGLAVPATAHDRSKEKSHSIDAAEARKALEGAAIVMREARKNRSARPLAAQAPALRLLRWLDAAAELDDRKAIARVEAELRKVGYRSKHGSPLEHWYDHFYVVMLTYESIRKGEVGKDAAPLFSGLATGKRRAKVRRQIGLRSVTQKEAAAVRPHLKAIDALLKQARSGR